MCHYYYSTLLLFATTERMLSASYLFIISPLDLKSLSKATPLLPPWPHVDRLGGDE